MGDRLTIPEIEALVMRLKSTAESVQSAADNIDFPAAYLNPACDYVDSAEVVATTILALQADLAAAQEALKPFAEAAGRYDPDDGDDDQAAWANDFTIGDLRRARAAHSAGARKDG
jgi:hypothetical protein